MNIAKFKRMLVVGRSSFQIEKQQFGDRCYPIVGVLAGPRVLSRIQSHQFTLRSVNHGQNIDILNSFPTSRQFEDLGDGLFKFGNSGKDGSMTVYRVKF